MNYLLLSLFFGFTIASYANQSKESDLKEYLAEPYTTVTYTGVPVIHRVPHATAPIVQQNGVTVTPTTNASPQNAQTAVTPAESASESHKDIHYHYHYHGCKPDQGQLPGLNQPSPAQK